MHLNLQRILSLVLEKRTFLGWNRSYQGLEAAFAHDLESGLPIGTVRFIFYELENNSFREERIGTFSYARLTVPPRTWFGFQGISGAPSLMLNVANMPHDPKEIERKSLEEIRFDWQEV